MRPTFQLKSDKRTVEIKHSQGQVYTSARTLLTFADSIRDACPEQDRYAPAPNQRAHFAHTDGNLHVDVTRTGRVSCLQLLEFARRAANGVADPDESNGESFADGIVRLTKENQALTEQLEAAKAELQTFRRQPGRARPLTDLELALLRRLEGK
jgi:hypothetical protein